MTDADNALEEAERDESEARKAIESGDKHSRSESSLRLANEELSKAHGKWLKQG